MSASQAKEMSSIPSIREGEGFISMEDVRLVASFVKQTIKFCNEKRAAATAAKKCVCVENGIMQQPCFVKLTEFACAFKLYCNGMFDDHDTVYKRIVFGKAMGNLTAIVNHVFEQPMLTNGHVPFYGKTMKSVWFGAKLLESPADSALIIARTLPSYSEMKAANIIAFNASFVNHIHASARVIQVAVKRYKFKLLQLKCTICTRQGRLRAVTPRSLARVQEEMRVQTAAAQVRHLHAAGEAARSLAHVQGELRTQEDGVDHRRLHAATRDVATARQHAGAQEAQGAYQGGAAAATWLRLHTAPPPPRASFSVFDIPPPKMQEQWETMNRGKRIPVSPPEMMDFASDTSASSAKAPSLLSVNNPYSRLSVASVASVASTDTSASSVLTSVESIKSIKSIKSNSGSSLLSSQSLSSTASSGFPPATPSTGGPAAWPVDQVKIMHGGLDPRGKKLAALQAALVELKGYADVLKKDDPTIMATKTTEVIKEVADRMLIPFEDNYLQLARLIFQRLVGKLTNSPEVSCETPLQAYRAYKSL